MGYKVIPTPQSLDDLEEIVSLIAKDNPERARTFGNELIDRALSVAARRLSASVCEKMRNDPLEEKQIEQWSNAVTITVGV